MGEFGGTLFGGVRAALGLRGDSGVFGFRGTSGFRGLRGGNLGEVVGFWGFGSGSLRGGLPVVACAFPPLLALLLMPGKFGGLGV